MHVDLRVHLDDGLFDQAQRSSQIHVLVCPSCRREQPQMSYALPESLTEAEEKD